MFMTYISIDLVMDKGRLIELNLVYIAKVDAHVNTVIPNLIYFFQHWLTTLAYIVPCKNKS